ncbi:MAG: cyclodeaminase/cyclohydrolase family protein [Filifactoraceae bacterium]
MNLTDLTLDGFVSEIASPSPAPGGGSCAAYSASVGAALVEMMAHLSFGKKAYEGRTEEEKIGFEKSYMEISRIKDQLEILVDKDTAAFEKVMAAFKLPKDTDEEKTLRKQAIDDATWICVDVPYKVAVLAKKGIEIAKSMIDIGNQNAITDIGVGILMLHTGLEGAILNIKVNLCSVIDQERALSFRTEIESLYKEATDMKEVLLSKVHKAVD